MLIDINTENINSILKLYQSSWYAIKYSIFNNIYFRYQLILWGNNKTAVFSSPYSIDYITKSTDMSQINGVKTIILESAGETD